MILNITILGSGTSMGVPMIGCNCSVCSSSDSRDKRLRSSVLLEADGKNIVIDTGPDFRQQMLQNRVAHLDAVLLTHEHNDHIAGLDDVRAFNWINGSSVNVYAEPRVLNSLRKGFSYAFSEIKFSGLPEITLNEIGELAFFVEGIKILPIRVMHHQLPILGYRIDDFTYITDVNSIPESEFDKIIGTKVLVIDGLRKEPHISHYSLCQALEVVEKVKPYKAYITHISHQLGLHSEVNKTLPEGVELAYDGLQIEL